MRCRLTSAVALVLCACATNAVAQSSPAGNVDPMFGPATRVNQGAGMTDEIRRALRPDNEHAVLARLEGDWRVDGVSGSQGQEVSELAQIRPMLDGAWFEVRLTRDRELARLIHLGFDGYRGS
jgi:hypothetical protein